MLSHLLRGIASADLKGEDPDYQDSMKTNRVLAILTKASVASVVLHSLREAVFLLEKKLPCLNGHMGLSQIDALANLSSHLPFHDHSHGILP